jgi:membrane dipeptidase
LKIPIIDLHEDISLYFLIHGGGEPLGDLKADIDGRSVDIPKYIRGNVKLVFATIFPAVETFRPESIRLEKLYGMWPPAVSFRVPQSYILEHFSIYYRLAETYSELTMIDTIGDVERVLVSENKIGLLLHLEGADALDDPYDLILLKKLGLRSIGITWNYNNKYGSGCMSKKDYGLTPEGEELVKTASKIGIIVDVAHASKRTALEVIEISSKPVIISHANVRKFVDTPRNVDDEVLEALHKNKGVIGLSVIGPLIANKPKPTLDDLVQHFIYIYEKFGSDIIAIGTDFPRFAGSPSPKDLESIDKIQVLIERLKEKGLGNSDLRKTAYENALRVLKANLTS